MSNMKTSNSHPILGCILGIAGIAVALLFALITGVIGGAVALILGVLALMLGIKARGKGWAAILTGVVAIILAIVMTVITIGAIGTMRDKAVAIGEAPLIAQYANKPYLGIMGIALEAANDGSMNLEEISKELDILNKTPDPVPAVNP